MRNVCVFLAIFISLTFSFANSATIKRGKYSKKKYGRLRVLAMKCKKAGDFIDSPESCYKCGCFSEGILECYPGPDCDDDEASGSREEERSAEQDQIDNYPNEQSDEADTLAGGKKKSNASKQKGLSKLSPQQFQDLRDAATSCNPGDEPLQGGCVVCNCVMKGIFSCVKSSSDACSGSLTIPNNDPNEYM